jgi:hypothetical protein
MRVSAATILGILTSVTLSFPVAAETIHLAPVEISALNHTFEPEGDIWNPSFVRDGVTFPSGPGSFSGPGFSASIGTGDNLIARFQAPVGKKFVITKHSDAAAQCGFHVVAYWTTGKSDGGSHFVTGSVTFENLSGAAPVNIISEDGAYDDGQAIHVWEDFNIVGDCEFTAIVVQFPVTHTLAKEWRTYSSVNSFAYPSFAAVAWKYGMLTDQTIMAIVDIGPATCAEVIADGFRLAMDLNGDCYVNLADLALLIDSWMACNNPADPDCTPNWF